MLRKDLIERQVEELARVLAKMLADALGLKTDAGLDSESISLALQQQLGIDIDTLIHLPDAEFLQALQHTGKFDSGNLEKLGDLLLLRIEKMKLSSSNVWRSTDLPIKFHILSLYEKANGSCHRCLVGRKTRHS